MVAFSFSRLSRKQQVFLKEYYIQMAVTESARDKQKCAMVYSFIGFIPFVDVMSAPEKTSQRFLTSVEC